jgi:lipase chaperone LimK
MRRAILATLVALLAAGVLLVRGTRPSPPAGAPAASAPADVADDGAPSGSSDLPALNGDRLARPRSLRGTRIDGGLAVDANGRFVPTLETRRFFDYFLTASGEVPADALRARIEHEIGRRLAPAAARDAMALLQRYLAYRERVRQLATVEVPDDDDLEARLAMLVALRREVLGNDAAEAFFADEEADARRLLATRRIANDASLTPEERLARIDAIYADAEAELPADIREAREAARLATSLRDTEAEIRARGGDEAEIAAVRERLAGPEAAARLADLDRRRSAWQARVAAFRAARDRVQHDATLSPDARAAAITRLLDESFDPAERRRVAALDRIDGTASDATPPGTVVPERADR